MNWTDLINDIRARTGWTDAQLAEKADCTQATINRLRRGTTASPSLKVGDALRDIHKRYKRRKVAA